MSKRYLVLAMRKPAFDPAVVGPHLAFRDGLRPQGCLELAGAFGDRSGGAYVLQADDLEAARAIAYADPLHAAGASTVTVHEWRAN